MCNSDRLMERRCDFYIHHVIEPQDTLLIKIITHNIQENKLQVATS